MRFNLRWDRDSFDLWLVRAAFTVWATIAVGAFVWAIVGGDFAVFLGLASSLVLVVLGGRALSLLYYLSLRDSKLHVRELFLGTTVAYKDVDDMAFDAKTGGIRITYRPYAGKGKLETYKADIVFRPKEMEPVLQEIRSRVEAAKPAKT